MFELDFVIALEGQIIPVEVKPGATGSLKSLYQFMGHKKALFAIRFDASLPTKSQVVTKIRRKNQQEKISYPLLSLPLYLVERLGEVVGHQLLAEHGGC